MVLNKATRKKLIKKKVNKKKSEGNDLVKYELAQKPEFVIICRMLRLEINKTLPKATPKLYHRMPVWFVGENAVVGYSVTAHKGVNLLFWNGQNLGEPDLEPSGQFEAAQIKFKDVREINRADLRRWLKKAGKNIWDFKSLRESFKSKTI